MDIQSFSNSATPASRPVAESNTTLKTATASTVSAAPIASNNPVSASTSPDAQKPITKEQVTKAVEDINKTIKAASQNLEFSIDNDSSQVVVKVVDQQTKQVLRQIPTVEVLEIAKSLDKLQGLLIKQTA